VPFVVDRKRNGLNRINQKDPATRSGENENLRHRLRPRLERNQNGKSGSLHNNAKPRRRAIRQPCPDTIFNLQKTKKTRFPSGPTRKRHDSDFWKHDFSQQFIKDTK
jgi:hypothetical protein